MNTAYSFKINTSTGKLENTYKYMTRVVDNFTAILHVYV